MSLHGIYSSLIFFFVTSSSLNIQYDHRQLDCLVWSSTGDMNLFIHLENNFMRSEPS